MKIMIRPAVPADAGGIERLLKQICKLHAEGRPDLFKADGAKYDRDEVRQMIGDNNKRIFCAVDETDTLYGYAICLPVQKAENGCEKAAKELYVDDLCVDETMRGSGIGALLVDYVKDYAELEKYDFVTLNVWEFNAGAHKFYQNNGFSVRKTTLEYKIRRQ